LNAGAATRTAIVTGGASGIGAQVARDLAARGVDVAVLDRDLDAARSVATECATAGVRSTAIQMDQRSAAAVNQAVDDAVSFLGGLDGLFANAGYGQFSGFLETTPENWMRHVDVNLTGTFLVCNAVSHHLVRLARGGSIVVNASSGGAIYSERLFAYCVTKAGLVMAAKGMAAELGVHRIRVNAILPGVIETRMTESQLQQSSGIVAETPLGRVGTTQEVSKLVCFLLGDEASFISGATVSVDGGQTAYGNPRWFTVDGTRSHKDNWTAVE
jgi:NAD(P)-dependent dehydrogenase (short-subunit alcohol dehydrogenase family)